MKIKCAIVDDEPLALALLESYARKTPFLDVVATYSSAVAAMTGIAEAPVDLLFLDIQMPELSGLEFSRMLPATTRVVFTTAFSQYAIDGYKVNAIDYLLKPISYADFLQAAVKAQQWFEAVKTPASDSIFVKSEYRLVRIDLQDIIYIEGLKDYVKIYIDTAGKSIVSQMSLKALEETLSMRDFMRVHRSYIVRKDKVRVVERGRILFGDKVIPIGDSYKEAFQNFVNT